MDEYKLLTEELCTSFGGEGWHELINLLEAGYRGEFVALRYLRENGRETVPGSWPKQMRISTARVAAILKSLARKKYICRTRSEKDGRSFIVRATAGGVAGAGEAGTGGAYVYRGNFAEAVGGRCADLFASCQRAV